MVDGISSIFDPNESLDREGSDFYEERLLSREFIKDDQEGSSLRPRLWTEYFGQDKIKHQLEIAIQAAKQRGEMLDHVLLYGPPGLGKTTLASLIAREMGAEMRMTSGPAIERQGDLAALLTNLKAHDVLFIDEIHRLNRQVEEILYPAMEDYALDIMIGKGPSARSIRLDLPKFTLIGATTRAGLLTSPLRDRFGLICRLELYDQAALEDILARNALVLGVELEPEGRAVLAGRCRGTPRIALRLLRRLRDFAEVLGNGRIDRAMAEKSLAVLEIDELGLDQIDRNLLRRMAVNFAGGPVGLDTLAAITGEDATTIEDVYEPYLLQQGFLNKTPRGRMLTEKAWRHLGLEEPQIAAAEGKACGSTPLERGEQSYRPEDKA